MASFLRPALFILLAFLLLHEECNGIRLWMRRRRRRTTPPCPPRNCQVGPWSSWSPCNHRCGSEGVQYRTRVKLVTEQCGGVCPYHPRETRPCSRNTCQNGGTPSRGYCFCPHRFTGTCCETDMMKGMTTPPTTTTSEAPVMNVTMTPNISVVTGKPMACFCYNGGSPVCDRYYGRQKPCICFNGYYGNRCQYGTTSRPYSVSVSTGKPMACFCYNGGSPVCDRDGRQRSCICFNGYYGFRCEYAGTTSRPYSVSVSTGKPFGCFCYNGGSPVCDRDGRQRSCICFNGYYGFRCEYAGTTSRPYSATSYLERYASKCFKCLSPYPIQCKPKIEYCFGDRQCFIGRYTIKSTGRRVYASGCIKPRDCRLACDRARQTGKVSYCSVQCCDRDLCNYPVFPTATVIPTRSKNRLMLRVIFKLLTSLQHMIDAITTLLRHHFNKDLAALHKRELTDMMKNVEYTTKQLDESLDPEVLKAKQDVAQMRKRAMEMLKQLDDYTSDADSGMV